MGITKKQKAVFDFICEYFDTHGFSPTQEEIREHFSLKSLGSVQKYIQYLTNAGYLKNSWNARRGLEPVKPTEEALEIPLLGKVAAGQPIEDFHYNESISVPQNMVKGNDHFALIVSGNSMIEDGIFDGDTIIVKKQPMANNGQTVVALVENEATVKTFYKSKNQVELHPANSSMDPFIYNKGDVKIEGIVVGLLRTYL